MFGGMDRFWLLTWTTYGQWLPGDPRGSVTRVREHSLGPRTEYDVPGTPYIAAASGLARSAKSQLKQPPITLEGEQAEVLLGQFQETAGYRRWLLAAAAIMSNHIHIVVGVPGDPDPEKMLQSFKSYGSRALNTKYGVPAAQTWWTESGSKRKRHDDASVLTAIEYVRNQEFPLLIWINPATDAWRAG